MRKILLTIITIFALSVSANPTYEVRAVWLTTLGGLDWPRTRATDSISREKQKQELRQILDRLQSDGINMVYMQTRIRGTVIYPSNIEPWDGALTGRYELSPGYDPLAFAIDECHKRGIECHAWVVTIPAFKINAAKALGKRSLLHTHPKLLYKQNDSYYLDPSKQGTATYLERICCEIVENYDVDGIHFDYIRYPENTRNDNAQQKRDNITRIVRQLYTAIKTRKPWIKVSCSPVGKYRDTSRYSARGWNAYHAVFQDAGLWLKEGIMDMISPMMYFKDNHFFPFCAQWIEESNERIIAPGLGIYFLSEKEKNWDLVEVTRELDFIRAIGASRGNTNMGGAAYFRTRFLLDNVKGLEDWVRLHYYRNAAIVPPTPHCDAASETFTNQFTPPKRYALYASKDYPVDTSNPENLVRVYWGQPHYDKLAAELWEMNIAIVELDPWGQLMPQASYESTPAAAPQLTRKILRP